MALIQSKEKLTAMMTQALYLNDIADWQSNEREGVNAQLKSIKSAAA